MQHQHKILILTPVKDAEDFIDSYIQNLKKLTYSHKNISIGILESDSQDNTYHLLEKKQLVMEKEFRKVTLLKKDFGFIIPEGTPRWTGSIQYERRTILAKSRNHLLFKALGDEDWVLWLDVDLVEYPPDIIEKLLETGKDIVHPHCVTEYGGPSFDKNAWQDKGRKHMDNLRGEGDLVKLHSVGGTMLLIKADIHRDGLIFPPYLYGKKNKHIRRTQFFLTSWREKCLGIPVILKGIFAGNYQGEIETEGLGMMAHDMGHTCWGMPNLEIKHSIN